MMTKDEMTALLRSVGSNENTITAMCNAFDMGAEYAQSAPSREKLIAEVAVLTEMVRVLSDRVSQQALQALHDENKSLGLYEQEPQILQGEDYRAMYLKVRDELAELQQRTWVGLTWNDVPDEWVGKVAFMEGAKWADKQLKEKNSV